MLALVAVIVIAAAAGGTWYEVSRDGLRRRPRNPMYNSRVPS